MNLRRSASSQSHRSITAFVVATVLTIAPVVVRADNGSLAEALFRDGRTAMRDGDYATACPRLAESQRLDPSAGTLLNLALCEEQLGHVATAWAHFRGVIDQVPESDERAPIARDHAASLLPRLPSLRIRVEGRPLDRATILLDGVELHAASMSGVLPVDPGAHVLVGRSVGAPEQRVAFTMAEAEKRDETIVFPAAVPIAPDAPSAAHARASTTAGHGPRARRIAEYTLFGVGAAGVVASVVLAGFARGKQGDVDAHCHGNACDPVGVAAAHDGATYERWATIGFVGGVVAIGAGTWFALSAPSAPTAPTSGRAAAPMMLRVGGSF